MFRLFFAYTRRMRVTGYERKTDWPKLGLSLLIATALIVAIRTAKWAAKGGGDAKLSDVDVDLDREVSYAVGILIRVTHELLRRHASLFPQKLDPTFEAGSDDDRPNEVAEKSIRQRGPGSFRYRYTIHPANDL